MEKFTQQKFDKDDEYFERIARLAKTKEKYPLGQDDQVALKQFLDNATPDETEILRRKMELQDKHAVLFDRWSEEEIVKEIIHEIGIDPELKEYLEQRLPGEYGEKYFRWKKQTEEGGSDSIGLSEQQLRLFFDYVLTEKLRILEAFKYQALLSQWTPDGGIENVATALHENDKSEIVANRYYNELRDIIDYVNGTNIENITNRIIEDENFRKFLDRVREALGK